MAKSKPIITKKLGSRILPAATNAAVGGAGFLASRIAINKIVEKKPDFVKASGPAAFIAGTLISAIANPKDKTGALIQRFGEGIAIHGANTMADAFIPEDTKAKIGLSGIGSGSPADYDLDKLAEEAANEVEQEVQGIYDDKAYLPTGGDKPADGGYQTDAPSMQTKSLPPEPVSRINPISHTTRAVPTIVRTISGIDDTEEVEENLY